MRQFRFGQRVMHSFLGRGTIVAFEAYDELGNRTTFVTEDIEAITKNLLGINLKKNADSYVTFRIVVLLDEPAKWRGDSVGNSASPHCSRNNLTPLDEPDFKN